MRGCNATADQGKKTAILSLRVYFKPKYLHTYLLFHRPDDMHIDKGIQMAEHNTKKISKKNGKQ